jgi:hypothetical protein
MASLLQHKNASIKRLKRLIFGPSSDKRAATGSTTEEEATAPGDDSEQQPGSDFIQLTGQPLVGATRYQQEVRCSACLERFTAPMPAGVTPEKYDVTCDVSLAIAKYGASLPWYRLARMQESFSVPVPESVQFERLSLSKAISSQV